jgi:hypothetical protein
MGQNVLFMCIKELIYHLSVRFLDIDVQEISGKHPENSGNLLSQTGYISRKYTFLDWYLFPGFSCLIVCGLVSTLLVMEIS